MKIDVIHHSVFFHLTNITFSDF